MEKQLGRNTQGGAGNLNKEEWENADGNKVCVKMPQRSLLLCMLIKRSEEFPCLHSVLYSATSSPPLHWCLLASCLRRRTKAAKFFVISFNLHKLHPPGKLVRDDNCSKIGAKVCVCVWWWVCFCGVVGGIWGLIYVSMCSTTGSNTLKKYGGSRSMYRNSGNLLCRLKYVNVSTVVVAAFLPPPHPSSPAPYKTPELQSNCTEGFQRHGHFQ